MPFLTESERQSVLTKLIEVVEQKFADPKLNGVNFRQIAEERAKDIAACNSVDEFEARINDLLQCLKASHTGFFHESRPRSSGRIAVAATFTKTETKDGERWVFQDVHPGGVAAQAGIQSGDVLLTVDGKEVAPPEAALFALGTQHDVTVRKASGDTTRSAFAVPNSRQKNRPLVVPDQVVTVHKPHPDVGVIRVSMFPDLVGIDVARDISAAVEQLDCERLIIDLRGNTGGGIGCLRLMSILCPDKRGVGYTVMRKQIERGFDKEKLPRFDRIPDSKLGLLPLLLKFGLAGRSVAVFSEGLGAKKHHGRVALLVNEHSASASEMVVAFAWEERLATLIGVQTPGRLVAASSFKVGHGYRVALPVGAYYTWRGTKLEGRGIPVAIEEPVSVDALWAGEDNQLRRAIDVVRQQRAAAYSNVNG